MHGLQASRLTQVYSNRRHYNQKQTIPYRKRHPGVKIQRYWQHMQNKTEDKACCHSMRQNQSGTKTFRIRREFGTISSSVVSMMYGWSHHSIFEPSTGAVIWKIHHSMYEFKSTSQYLCSGFGTWGERRMNQLPLHRCIVRQILPNLMLFAAPNLTCWTKLIQTPLFCCT